MPLYGTKTDRFRTINRSIIRNDQADKLTGKALYTADLVFPGMLWGGELRSPYAHAKVTSIDTSAAKAVPGVVTVLSFEDLTKKESWSTYYYLTDHILFEGDVVAIVAAEDKQALKAGLEAIKVTYEELPAVFTVDDALKPDAPILHENCEQCDGNIWLPSRHKVRKGDVEVGFANSDVIVEREYETGNVEHAYLEPEAVVAVPGPDSTMTIHACPQNPFFTRRWVADALDVPRPKVRIIQETTGGSFGGKEEYLGLMASRAALMARATDRPVKMVASREESIISSTKRHPFKMKYKVGVNKDGKLQAFQVEIIENIGAYHMHQFMNFRASIHAAGVYDIPNVKVDVFGVFTNNVTSGAFRGYSAPQNIFGEEQLYEEVAKEIGMDPLEFKKLNMLKQGSVSSCGQLIEGEVILPELIDAVTEKTDYIAKRDAYAKQTGDVRKGIGLAIFYRGCGLGAETPDASAGFVSIHDDGTVMVKTGLTDIGQGLRTAYSQIVAEALGVPVDVVFVAEHVDTHQIPDSNITAASRGTVMGAQSVKKAALELKEILKETAAMMFEAGVEDIELEDGMFSLKGVPDAVIPFQAVCNVHHWTGQQCAVMTWFKPPAIDFSNETGFGKAFPTYTYSAEVAEVEVDMKTGTIKVERITAAHDIGTIINPSLVRGQLFGGVLQGMGFGMMENLAIRDGIIGNRNFDTYLIATTMDIPEIDYMLYESEDPAGTYGAKSIGESVLEGVGPAVALALRNALQQEIRKVPINKVDLYEMLYKQDA